MKDNCETIRESLGVYVYESAPEEIERHLQTCTLCRDEWQELKNGYDRISSLLPEPSRMEEETIKKDLKQALVHKISLQRKMFLWSKKISAAAILIAFGILIGSQTFAKKDLVKKDVFMEEKLTNFFVFEDKDHNLPKIENAAVFYHNKPLDYIELVADITLPQNSFIETEIADLDASDKEHIFQVNHLCNCFEQGNHASDCIESIENNKMHMGFGK